MHNYLNCKVDLSSITNCVRKGNFAGVRALVTGGTSVNFQTETGETPAIYCCCFGECEILKFLLQNGANAELANKYGSPLSWAAVHGQTACIVVLLAHGVLLDAVNLLGETALWKASMRGHLAIVKLLVDAGADPNRADNDGKTPRAIATDRGRGASLFSDDTERCRAAVAKFLDPKELNWRRRFPLAAVVQSVKGAPTLNNAMQVLQCNDMAREIGSFL